MYVEPNSDPILLPSGRPTPPPPPPPAEAPPPQTTDGDPPADPAVIVILSDEARARMAANEGGAARGRLDGSSETPHDDVEDVIVTGSRIGPPELVDRERPNPKPNPGLDGGGGGGGGGFVAPQNPTGWSACQDRKTDTLAEDINQEIQRQPDKATREYGAFIWKDAQGQLHRSSLISGNNFRLTGIATFNPAAEGFTYSQVVGMVHSHPDMIDTGTEANPTGTYIPAWQDGGFDKVASGDWFNADSLVAAGADAANLTLYISHNGRNKEFDYADNGAESRSATNAPGSGAESGDYDPGATCPS